MAAAPEHADIVGGKVLKIGKTSADDALAAVAPLVSRDNPMGMKLNAPMVLANPAALTYLKLTDDVSRVSLTVANADSKEATVDLAPRSIPLGRVTPKDFVWANTNAKVPKPLAYKDNDVKYWFEHDPEKKLVYFQYNEVGNKPGETLKKFCERMFEFIEGNAVERLVIDLRNNDGGNNFLNQPLVHGLIRCEKVNRPGHLFVLIGRRTFSAAMSCAGDIERNTRAIFVGEPTGSSPNHVGETTPIMLPCSKLRLSCASLYWQHAPAMDRRIWIAPSLVAEPSIALFAQNRDPGMEAIHDYLATVK